MTAFGQHPSRCAEYFGTPDITVSDKNPQDSGQVSHTVYRTVEPIEDFLRNSPHALNLKILRVSCHVLMPSIFGESLGDKLVYSRRARIQHFSPVRCQEIYKIESIPTQSKRKFVIET